MARLIPTLCLLFIMALSAPVSAQFHQKTSTGQTAARQMNNPFNGTGNANSPGVQNREIKSSSAFITPTQIASNAGSHVKIRFKNKMDKVTDVWGRTENHSNGTYTETVFDEENPQADNLVIQHTKKKSMSGDDPIVLTRKISLNHMGQPDEVMIYDGSDRYKYHGKFIYDSFGRLLEEQLSDARGNPLRRTIQRYSPEGEFLPLETYDYVKNVPQDLEIVVSRTDSLEQEKLEELNSLYNEAQKQGLFSEHKKKKADEAARKIQEQFQERNSASPAYQGTVPAPSASAQEIGGKKFQLFRKRSRD